ncbi:MAG: oxidative damage protection protein [Chloroflexi bacterium]|nr:oxidative damage protection protein [Chloroflexota bacterium]
MVMCVKFGKGLPGLERAPRNDELGKRIFENVSQDGWKLWQDQQTILINHYSLNMANAEAHEFLSTQMEEFFFGEGAKLPDDWIPEDQRGQQPGPDGKGAQGGKGASASKGAPAPAQK